MNRLRLINGKSWNAKCDRGSRRSIEGWCRFDCPENMNCDSIIKSYPYIALVLIHSKKTFYVTALIHEIIQQPVLRKNKWEVEIYWASDGYFSPKSKWKYLNGDQCQIFIQEKSK